MARPKGSGKIEGSGRTKGHKGIHRLSVKEVSSKSAPGVYADGGGLYMRVAQGGSKSWVFRYMLNGKPHNMGLGATHTITLDEARERARQWRLAKSDKHDPIEQHRAALIANAVASVVRVIPTFGEVAEKYITSKEKAWKDRAEGGKWRAMLRKHAASLWLMQVDKPETRQVLDVLEPLWEDRYKLARTLQYRIETVFSVATVEGHRSGRNPAQWKGYLDKVLVVTPEAREVENRPALPWQEVPAFVGELQAIGGVKAKAMELLILTATRAGGVVETAGNIGMQWSEIDWATATWTIPKERMKGPVRHRVPLSDRAVAILRDMEAVRTGERVFPIGYDSLKKWLPSLRQGITLHGFRTSLTGWATVNRIGDKDVRDKCIAHYEGSKTDKAYDRDDLLELRRPVMAKWADYCCGGEPIAVAA